MLLFSVFSLYSFDEKDIILTVTHFFMFLFLFPLSFVVVVVVSCCISYLLFAYTNAAAISDHQT